ncbi:MAG: helix-turn-helix transcriptional regulator [Paenibacillaceae bacterium]
MSTLGERIKKIRKINKLSQVDFSNILGVSQGTLSELELNKYKPSIETVMAIIKQFNTDSNWLLFGSENQQGVHNNFDVRINEKEAKLISTYRKLKTKDQEEIIDIIGLKIDRY